MQRVPADESFTDSSSLESVTIDPVVRGFIRDWDAMEDLLSHVLYTGLGWEIGNEGQILFTDPLATPKVGLVKVFSLSNLYLSFVPGLLRYVLFYKVLVMDVLLTFK